jgi:hypothetical protein
MGLYDQVAQRGLQIGQLGIAQEQQNRAMQFQAMQAMQRQRAQDLYRQQAMQVQQQRYLADLKQKQDDLEYRKMRDAANNASREKIAGIRAQGGGRVTAVQRAQNADVNTNRWMNEQLPPAATTDDSAANAARDQYFQQHPDETPGSPTPYTGGVTQFKDTRRRIDTTAKAVDTAQRGYDANLASNFPGITQDFLDSTRDPKTGGYNVPFGALGSDDKPTALIINGPNGPVRGTQQGWRQLLGDRSKLDSLRAESARLPKDFPTALPPNIANLYQDQPPAGPAQTPSPAELSGGVVEPPLPTGGATGGVVQVSSPAEAMKLPSGTVFTTPDGVTRTRH